MSRLRHNVIANFGGHAISVAVGVAFMPIYVRILGVEAYGIIGLYLSLQALFGILDMGLSATLNREFASFGGRRNGHDQRRDLLLTLEGVYWPAAALIALITAMAGQPIATHWLNPAGLDPSEASRAISLMGLATALQWPTALYEGGFRGLERQVLLNAMGAGFALFRALGSVFVLVFISPTLVAFLLFQLVVAASQTLVYRRVLWRSLPSSGVVPRFRTALLKQVMHFTLGMAGIAALSFILMQSDRLILAKLLPLELLGYYTIAGTVTAALSTMAGSFFNAHFPRFTALIHAEGVRALADLYHQSSQYLAVIVASVACIFVFFSRELLLLWTRNPAISEHSGPILSVLVVGTALNAVMYLPYALQLASGWTRLAFWQNVASVAVVVPATWWAALNHGSLGAASVWVALNVGYITVGIPLMHRRLLRGEMRRWYLADIAPPFLAAATTAALSRHLLGQVSPDAAGIAKLGIACIVVLLSATLFAPLVRQGLSQQASRLVRRK